MSASKSLSVSPCLHVLRVNRPETWEYRKSGMQCTRAALGAWRPNMGYVWASAPGRVAFPRDRDFEAVLIYHNELKSWLK